MKARPRKIKYIEGMRITYRKVNSSSLQISEKMIYLTHKKIMKIKIRILFSPIRLAKNKIIENRTI